MAAISDVTRNASVAFDFFIGNLGEVLRLTSLKERASRNNKPKFLVSWLSPMKGYQKEMRPLFDQPVLRSTVTLT